MPYITYTSTKDSPTISQQKNNPPGVQSDLSVPLVGGHWTFPKKGHQQTCQAHEFSLSPLPKEFSVDRILSTAPGGSFQEGWKASVVPPLEVINRPKRNPNVFGKNLLIWASVILKVKNTPETNLKNGMIVYICPHLNILENDTPHNSTTTHLKTKASEMWSMETSGPKQFPISKGYCNMGF